MWTQDPTRTKALLRTKDIMRRNQDPEPHKNPELGTI